MTARVLGEASDYAQLHKILRDRREELDISLFTVGHVAGLQDGYANKLLAPTPMKRLGNFTMGPVLQTLGLKLIVVEDAEALERIKGRLIPRRRGRDSI